MLLLISTRLPEESSLTLEIIPWGEGIMLLLIAQCVVVYLKNSPINFTAFYQKNLIGLQQNIII